MDERDRPPAGRRERAERKDREARLKAALQANIARRKALARARAAREGEDRATAADGEEPET